MQSSTCIKITFFKTIVQLTVAEWKTLMFISQVLVVQACRQKPGAASIFSSTYQISVPKSSDVEEASGEDGVLFKILSSTLTLYQVIHHSLVPFL